MRVKPLNMVKITTGIGMGNSLSNRSVSSLNILAKLNVLFIKLAEKIIPAFEKAHGPSYQALIMVDNSQGHSAYSVDALLTSRMNMRPGGKQANMRDGWFVQHGE
jgi:hypothetical protein